MKTRELTQNEMDFVNRIYEHANTLDNFKGMFYSILKLGKPVVFEGDVEVEVNGKIKKRAPGLAAICLLAKKYKKVNESEYLFLLHKNFFEIGLTHQEGLFVFMHELMHILFKHLEIAEYFDDPVKFNHATDCVINDIITGTIMPESPEIEHLVSILIRGMNKIGEDCSDKSVSYVYERLPDEEYDGNNGDNDEQAMSFFDGMSDKEISDFLDTVDFSQGGRDPVDGQSSSTENSKNMQRLADRLNRIAKEKLEQQPESTFAKKLEQAKKDLERCSKSAGGVSIDPSLHSMKRSIDPIWNRLVTRSQEALMKSQRAIRKTYHRRNPRYASLGNAAITKSNWPTYDNAPKPFFILAIDASGSISPKWREFVLKRVKGLPDDVYARVCTFSTYTVPFDVKKDTNLIAEGGTAFGPIVEFVHETEAKEKRKADQVVIFTDCEFYDDVAMDQSKGVDNRYKFVLIENSQSRIEPFETSDWDNFWRKGK